MSMKEREREREREFYRERFKEGSRDTQVSETQQDTSIQRKDSLTRESERECGERKRERERESNLRLHYL